MDSSLGKFLQYVKGALQSQKYSEVHLVLGNEACDLDSAVSSITYAYSLYKVLIATATDELANNSVMTKQGQTCSSKLVIPVMNIPREDYRLRTEITYTMERYELSLHDLIFIDEIDLKMMKDHGKLKVTLVDHNIISADQAFLRDVLIEVIDHHKDEIPSSPNFSKTIELVGSCTTLVAEKILQKAPNVLDQQVISLLLAAILLDTVNLDPRAGRMTDKDVRIVEQLKKHSTAEIKCDELYLKVSKAKFDFSSLTCIEILRKDFKSVPKNPKSSLTVGISSTGLPLQSFLLKTNVANDIKEFTQLRGLDVLVIMAMFFETLDGPPCRQIAVCGEKQDGVQGLSQFLANKSELELVTMHHSYIDHCVCFDQMNVKASRKMVFPLVMEFLDS